MSMSLSDIHTRLCSSGLREKALAYDEDVRFLIDMINRLKQEKDGLMSDAMKLSRLKKLEEALASAGYTQPCSARA